ncbi:MAG: hypothetical protein HY644_05910 [Acidobacteria bacterium]|nr:hypothetical protein [Acidobacteriota bacterium]
MRISTGRVEAGKIIVEGAPLAEGAKVTVLAFEGHETFRLAEGEEQALLKAIAEADRGEVVAQEVLFRNLGGGD